MDRRRRIRHGARDHARTQGGLLLRNGGSHARESQQFGGNSGSARLDDTWTFDGTTWARVNGPAPPARANHAMATINGMVVLFGGNNPNVGVLNDTWTFNGTTWTQVDGAAPSARFGHAMATVNGNIVLFG